VKNVNFVNDLRKTEDFLNHVRKGKTLLH